MIQNDEKHTDDEYDEDHDEHDEHDEHDDDDGEWSVVSDVSPTQEDFSRCQHVRTPWRGSNQYQRRLVCKDCGQILFLTKAPKKKITKKNPPNECDFIMVFSVSA
jgi:hypothetical protein